MHEKQLNINKSYFSTIYLVGLVTMVVSFSIINEEFLFPGWIALLPVLSCLCILIAQPNPSSYIYSILSNKFIAFFGKISYPLYLIHWPAIVFFSLYISRDISQWEKLSLITIIILLSTLIWLFIETPIRRESHGFSWDRSKYILAATLTALLICGAVTIHTSGFIARLSTNAQRMVTANDRNFQPDRTCTPIKNNFNLKRATICSLNKESSSIDYILWGDSHAGMYSSLLGKRLEDKKINGILISLPDCHPLFNIITSKEKNRTECSHLQNVVTEIIKTKNIKFVILASRWANMASDLRAPGDGNKPKILYDASSSAIISFESALSSTVSIFEKLGVKVIVLGPTPEMKFHVPDMMIRSANLNISLPVATRYDFDTRQRLVLRALENIEKTDRIRVIYPHKLMCNLNECIYHIGNVPLYSDDDHLNKYGVNNIVNYITSSIINFIGK